MYKYLCFFVLSTFTFGQKISKIPDIALGLGFNRITDQSVNAKVGFGLSVKKIWFADKKKIWFQGFYLKKQNTLRTVSVTALTVISGTWH